MFRGREARVGPLDIEVLMMVGVVLVARIDEVLIGCFPAGRDVGGYVVVFYGVVPGCGRDNNKKVEDPELLEAIRLTIINNLLEYHPVRIAPISVPFRIRAFLCFLSGVVIAEMNLEDMSHVCSESLIN
jgi:hypothetical protein